MKVRTIHPNKWTHEPSCQMISRWFSQWATSKHFWILRNVILIAALPQSKSSFFCGNPSLIYLFAWTALSGFQLMLLFSWDVFFHFFFIFFYCFTARLKLELCSKWMKFFISLKKKLFSSSTCIWSKWTFKVRNVG